MGLFKKIRKAFKKIVKYSTGGLIGGHDNSGQSAPEAPPAPELGFVEADPNSTTKEESEKQQLTKGKKRGKKSLKVNISGAGGAGRNIV